MKKFIEEFDASAYEVLTPTGFQPVGKIYKTVEYEIWEIITECGKVLRCADHHILINEYGEEVLAEDLFEGDEIQTIDGLSIIKSIRPTMDYDNMYDLSVMDSQHLYYTNGIVSHNTTTTMGYLLHEILTRDNIIIAILANKHSSAVEVLDRIKYAYECLPWFLQVGVERWNRQSIKLGNGSQILTAGTSSSSIRGKSINCLTGDTVITVEHAGEVFNVTLGELYDDADAYGLQRYQNITTGTSFHHLTNDSHNPTIRILSDGGVFRTFDGVKGSFVSGLLKVEFSNGATLTGTPEHLVYTKDGKEVMLNRLSVGDSILTENGTARIASITPAKGDFVFDLVNVHETHNYIANGILTHQCLYLDEFAHLQNDTEFYESTYPVISSGKSTQVIITSTPKGLNLFYKLHKDATEGRNRFVTCDNDWSVVPGRDEEWKADTIANTSPQQFAQEYDCAFLGSSKTLISGSKLQQLTFSDPVNVEQLKENPHWFLYESPKPNHNYVVTVDVAEGTGQDYSVVSVWDCTSTPFKLVGVYRNNLIVPIAFTRIVFEIGKQYNDAFVAVENNSIGSLVANMLYYELEYENFISSVTGQNLSEVGAGGVIPGIRTTKKTKAIGCSTLKTLIESNTLIFDSFDLFTELSTFSENGRGSYGAEHGKHDDIVMTAVLFAYLTTQPYFNDLFDLNTLSTMREAYEESDNISFMFISTHEEEEFDLLEV